MERVSTLISFGNFCNSVLRPDGKLVRFDQLGFDGNVLRGQTWDQLFTRKFWAEGFEVRFSGDWNSAAGRWFNTGFDEGGPTAWQRVDPQLDRMIIQSRDGNNLVVEMRGTNLSFAKPGLGCDLAFEESDMTLRNPRPGPPGDGSSVLIDVTVGPETVAGPKMLRVNGVRFEWNYRGTPAGDKELVRRDPKIVEFLFGWRDNGQFRAYGQTEPMAYDRPFVVRIRYETAPGFSSTDVVLAWDSRGSEQRHPVPVFRTRGDPAIFESADIAFEDPNSCRGLRFCLPAPGWSDGR